MRKMLIAAAFACAMPLLAACVTTQEGQGPPSPEAKVEQLDAMWTLAKTGAVAYVATCRIKPSASMCSTAVVDQVTKAIAVGEVGVDQARAAILAAGSDRSSLSKAVALGVSAIAVFQQAVLTYGVESS